MTIPEYKVEDIQSHTDAVVENNNGTASPIWQKYLEGIFNISKVVIDFEKDKVLVADPDLKYMSLMAAYISKTPPVVLELYIWVKVNILFKLVNIYFSLLYYKYESNFNINDNYFDYSVRTSEPN